MIARLEPVTTLATMFRWAATYSLALTEDALYVVRVGPAMGPAHTDIPYSTINSPLEHAIGAQIGVAMAQPALKKIEKRYGEKVGAGLARLTEHGHEALAAEKGSFRFGPGEVEAFEPGCHGTIDTMELKTSGRDFRFQIASGGRKDFEAFAEAVRNWAGLG